ERADRGIRRPGDTPAYLHLPELGVIPSERAARFGAARVRDHVELVTWRRKPSMIAESFRSVLMSILFSSGGPAEGKSTVVSNLGIAIAEIGRKVLLIDADLRKPRLQHIFRMDNERGLSDVLRGGVLDGLI